MKLQNQKKSNFRLSFCLDFYFDHFLNFASKFGNLDLLSSKFDGKSFNQYFRLIIDTLRLIPVASDTELSCGQPEIKSLE